MFLIFVKLKVLATAIARSWVSIIWSRRALVTLLRELPLRLAAFLASLSALPYRLFNSFKADLNSENSARCSSGYFREPSATCRYRMRTSGSRTSVLWSGAESSEEPESEEESEESLLEEEELEDESEDDELDDDDEDEDDELEDDELEDDELDEEELEESLLEEELEGGSGSSVFEEDELDEDDDEEPEDGSEDEDELEEPEEEGSSGPSSSGS